MDTILNAPLWLLAIAAVVGVALLFSGLRGGRQNLLRASWGVLGAVVVLLALRTFVPTDGKKVEHKARALMVAIGAKDWPTVDAMLSHASMYGWQGPELAKAAHDNVENYGLSDLTVTSLDVKKEPLAITARIAVLTRHQNQPVDNVPSTWDFQYQKRGSEWTLIEINPIKIGFGGEANPESILHAYVK